MSIPTARIKKCQRTKLSRIAVNVHTTAAPSSGQFFSLYHSRVKPSFL